MSEIVQSISIAKFVNQRQAVIERLDQAFRLIEEADRLARAANVGMPHIVIDPTRCLRGVVDLTGDYARAADSRRAARQAVDRKAWQHLMHESGLRTFLDATARVQWDNQISEGDFPELTAAAVETTFSQLYAARGDMFERGVVDCFRKLSWDYKTNEPYKFGERIIIKNLMLAGHPTDRINELDDLLRVMHVLDGVPQPDHRHAMASAIWDARLYNRTSLENDYIELKWFKVGTGHVRFKRMDLVASLNAIIAKRHPNALASELRR
ncbi:hypothetical protein HMPREF3069_04935 [Achromobacter xylosoxidans]|uniref:DUF4942 domain-containing protein n=1 Tax=Alcaligenes xylosoxydans xylosoxydans TaxID=85698 RepID=UPI0008A1B13B|nr:DUF4942 domain-containing protein [Achromobacter xylosoxidans]OFS61766.1 hypothetical protein HMPREF3069_04935 [Achromobacter xylosoxidans]